MTTPAQVRHHWLVALSHTLRWLLSYSEPRRVRARLTFGNVRPIATAIRKG